MINNTLTLDRRKRYKRPISIILIGSLLILYPFINIYNLMKYYHYSYIETHKLFLTLNPVQLLLLFFPWVSGIGLLLVKKWGWYLFLLNSFSLIIFNFYAIYLQPVSYNYRSLAEGLAVFGFSVFFLRRDISAPYMKVYPRGWRYEKRKPVIIDIAIDGKKTKTRDISSAGLYADWEGEVYELNTEVDVSILSKENIAIELKAGVVELILLE